MHLPAARPTRGTNHPTLVVGVALLLTHLAGCAGDSSPPSPVVASPPAPPTYTTSFPCADVSLPVQKAVCANSNLAALDMRMADALHRHLGDDDMVQRDQVLASQRQWLLGLAQNCPDASGSQAVTACLASQYQARIAALTQWQTIQAPWRPGPLQTYVTYKLLDAKDPSLCAVLLSQAPAALTPNGSLDPQRLDSAREIAGSHGAPTGANPDGGTVAVDLYRAGLYGGYQTRARSVTLDSGLPVLGSDAVGAYAATLPNAAGRFGTFASQTGDYGAIDVFVHQRQLLALVTDTIGFYTPADPGESALAAVFTLSHGSADRTCLFSTFLKAPYQGGFAEQPSLTPFLAVLDSIHGAPPEQLAGSDRQDTTQVADEVRWRLFNMPMLEVAAVQATDWTGWLRHRHDAVLDALFAWSQQSPDNKAKFDHLFALLRPAAGDLSRIYVQTQGLTSAEAGQATAIAIMELLYQATSYLAPGLGAGPVNPAAFVKVRPRYPILASPGA